MIGSKADENQEARKRRRRLDHGRQPQRLAPRFSLWRDDSGSWVFCLSPARLSFVGRYVPSFRNLSSPIRQRQNANLSASTELLNSKHWSSV